MQQGDHWHGERVLVVEDNWLLAEVLCDYLKQHRLTPVGPAGRIEGACQLARKASLDAAILDIKLAGQFCFPVCPILSDRGIPFLFLTGFDELAVIPSELREVPLLCKPFREDDMNAALKSLLAGRVG